MREYLKCAKCGKPCLPRADGICGECRKRKAYIGQQIMDLKKLKAPPKRKCHDCGKKTDNYRCDQCWAKLRRKLGIRGDAGETRPEI